MWRTWALCCCLSNTRAKTCFNMWRKNRDWRSREECKNKEGTGFLGRRSFGRVEHAWVCYPKSIDWWKNKEPSHEDWLWNNIFYTWVKHQGKVLNMIIDNGSRMNEISSDIMQKFWLLVEKHQNLYKLSWVDDTSIMVKHQCLITFFLDKNYGDMLWCDMIPIEGMPPSIGSTLALWQTSLVRWL